MLSATAVRDGYPPSRYTFWEVSPGEISMSKKMREYCKSLIRTLAAIAVFSSFVSVGQAEPFIDLGGRGDDSSNIVVPLNKAAIVDLPKGVSDVLLSQPNVVDAVVRSSNRVYLFGREVGQANAFFFDAHGRQVLNLEIQVERDVDALNDLLARLMPEARITAEGINDNIVLRGSVRSSVEAATAADIASRFAGDDDKVIPMLSIRQREQVMLKVRIVEMQRSVVKKLGVDLNGMAALSNASINAATGLGGAGAAASGLLFEGIRDFGTNGSNLGVSFEALEQIGVVRTLAEPTLTAVSGESANFRAGGEFPIPVNQVDNVVSIEFKKFGVALGFTPLVLDKGRINIKVSTEVSEVTPTNNFSIAGSTITLPGTPAVPGPPDQLDLVDSDGDGLIDTAQNVTQFLIDNGTIAGREAGIPATDPITISNNGLNIPAFTVRSANTTVELPSGGSLVMAGLLQENMRQMVEGIPKLKEIPILGQLFRSRDYQNSETELVIIATPYIVGPTHESKLTDPAKGFIAASDIEAELLGRITATYGLAGAGVEEKTLEGPFGFILD